MAAKHLLMKNNIWDVQSTSMRRHTASHRGLSQGAAQAHQRGSFTQQKGLPEGKAQIWAASASLGVFYTRIGTFFTCTQPPGTVPGQPQHITHKQTEHTAPGTHKHWEFCCCFFEAGKHLLQEKQTLPPASS